MKQDINSMLEIEIPYSRDYIHLALDKDEVKGILSSKVEAYEVSESQQDIVKNALDNPINSPNLKSLAGAARHILVITSDHTRPVPSKITLPILLKEIRSGNPGALIKILVATGLHRPTTKDEMIDKFGKDIVDSEDIVNHDCRDKTSLVFKGTLPSGGELWLNSLVDWADLVVSEGFIEPHFFAGFSGGRKSILPGIAGEKTVLANHCSSFIASDDARIGKLSGNPIHKDMLYAAGQAKLKFILNVVIDNKKRIINAFAGDSVKAHEKGCTFVRSLAEVEAVEGDIVITSNGGYPLDQNIYQAVKGMTAAESCVRKDGVIIIAAACNDGHGGESFYNWFANASSPREVADKISSISRNETIVDQWEAQILARVLMKAKVIMVSDECSRKYIQKMHMTYTGSLKEALEISGQHVGKNAGIVVIPDGVGVIVGKSNKVGV